MANNEMNTEKNQQDILSEFDKKIAYHERCIESLKQKKIEATLPSKKKQARELIALAFEKGMSIEDMTAKLGL